jgi:hypothetical protein
MHQIRLRGPWRLKKVNQGIEVSRKFHAPSGLQGKSSSEGPDRDSKIFFVLSSNAAFPLKWCSLNKTVQKSLDDPLQNFSSSDGKIMNSRFDLTAILLPFNEITLAWSTWPESWFPVEGFYTPNPDHVLHFDSWIEIIE